MDRDIEMDVAVARAADLADPDPDPDAADDVSDADSDYLELQADIARLDASRQAFLTEHLGPNYRPDDDERVGGGGRRRRGPRKAAEPMGEVKLRLQQAHQLFMERRYEAALAALHEIIRVNAETHAAWTLLASINEDLGRREEAIMAMVFAAHLEPKRVAGWLRTADYALAEENEEPEGSWGEPGGEAGGEAAGEADNDDDAAEGRKNRRLQNLQIARLCYSGAIRADKDNIAARLGKANVCLEFGQATNAATEYVRVLKRRPYALQVIRNLAEASYDSIRGDETIRAAIAAYRRAIAYLQRRDSEAGGGETNNGPGGWHTPDLVLDDDAFSWMDVTIYVELFAALGELAEAVAVLKRVARWMLGRGAEACLWDGQTTDDAEWDRADEPRRITVPGFQRGRYAAGAYGPGLPVDLRTKLAVYRLRLGDEEEALGHLAWIAPHEAATTEAMRTAPHLLKEVGVALAAAGRAELALQYLELYRMLHRGTEAEVVYNQYGDVVAGVDALGAGGLGDEDAEALVVQGTCNLALHDQAAAEECFLAAIEADDENVEARFELAKMYEQVQEKEQAFLLVKEALALAGRGGFSSSSGGGVRDGRTDGRDGAPPGDGSTTATATAADKRRPRHAASLETTAYRVYLDGDGKVVRRRRKYRQRRRRGGVMGGEGGTGGTGDGPAVRWAVRGHARRFFASPAAQAAFEAETSARLRARYQVCQEAKARANSGDAAAAAQWMAAAEELIADFRSFREFYTWDKYVQFLGYNDFLGDGETAVAAAAAAAVADGQSRDLTALAERLQQNFPDNTDAAEAPPAAARREFRGIPFDDWLALFLEYALGLAHAGRAREAYTVCQAAHDSTVYRQHDSALRIHLAWAACAVRAGDEQTCVAVARYFMRDRPFTTDCYRLFGAMCRLCRAPSAWFGASPAQKYILRQIRQRDADLVQAAEEAGQDPAMATDGLDVCLLVTYGHILFASASFHFALNYYQRALAVDPTNPVVCLCIGLCYVHWALKRQAENRQYLLLQGLNFLFRYVDLRLATAAPGSPAAVHARREAYYNVARTYHLLGLHALAAEYYGKVLDDDDDDADRRRRAGTRRAADLPDHAPDLRTEAAYNLRTYYLLSNNQEAALAIARAYLVL